MSARGEVRQLLQDQKAFYASEGDPKLESFVCVDRQSILKLGPSSRCWLVPTPSISKTYVDPPCYSRSERSPGSFGTAVRVAAAPQQRYNKADFYRKHRCRLMHVLHPRFTLAIHATCAYKAMYISYGLTVEAPRMESAMLARMYVYTRRPII